MFRLRLVRGALVLTVFLCPASLSYGQTTIAQLLRQQDEALLKAETTGDRKTWEHLTAKDFVFASEDSVLHTRSEFLQALSSPSSQENVELPAPDIRSYSVRVAGPTAIVTYFEYETGSYLGSPLTGHDLLTETWQRVGGNWKLRLLHMTAVPVDPPPVQLPPEEIDSLTGTYRAAGSTYLIRREGDRILASQDGGPEREKLATGYDLLFTPGRPRMRMIFRRDACGKVIAFASRNENRAIDFKRVEARQVDGKPSVGPCEKLSDKPMH